jgi:DNA sulfur modification protein DndE
MKILLINLFLIFTIGFTNDNKVEIFMIGDSTMANKKSSDAPETGWGQVFHNYFSDQVIISNHAVNGRSTKSFRDRGHWKEVLDQLEKDNYVIIQFGHNDAKVEDSLRFSHPWTAYKSNLITYINEVKQKGAIPILATPVYRRKYENGVLVDTHGDYPLVVRKLADSLKVDLLDMHKLSRDIISNHGEEGAKDMFMHFGPGFYSKFPKGANDDTHFSNYGANLIAAAAAKEIRDKHFALRDYLKTSTFLNKFVYELPIIKEPTFKKDTFNITRYGAIPSVSALSTIAIQSTIDNCAQSGGGVVFIPKGMWTTGPIVLKSGINLHLEEGAFLQFSDDRNQYPIVTTTWEGQDAYRCQAPISALNAKNIAITGNGNIDGAGQVWKSVKRVKLTADQWKKLVASGGVHDEQTWYPSEASRVGHNSEWAKKITPGKSMKDYESVRDFLRPNFVSFLSCENVMLDGNTFTNSPAWTLHPLMCRHTTVRNVKVVNPWFGQNNDAIDLESCDYGILDNCYFDTGDDAITLKSGRDAEGRKRGKPTQNWIIKNTNVLHGHGGFVIGSEMSGGVNNIYVDNCNFVGTDIGLRFKTTRGRGGKVSNIFISNIHMSKIVGEAIGFNMYYAAKDPIPLTADDITVVEYKSEPITDETPYFENFYMDHIYCNGAETALYVDGIPESNVSNLFLTNSKFKSNKAIVLNESSNVTLSNIEIDHSTGPLLSVLNSNRININGLIYNEKLAEIKINGKNTNNVVIQNSNPKLLVQKMTLGKGLDKKGIVIK